MKFLRTATLALVASLVLSGCASNKYYDLGFEIGSSADFVDSWSYAGERGWGFADFAEICKNFLESYKKETNDKSLVLPTTAELDSLIEGCRDGYQDAIRP